MAEANSSKGDRRVKNATASDSSGATEARARGLRVSAKMARASVLEAPEPLQGLNVDSKLLGKHPGLTDRDLRLELLQQAARALASPWDSQSDLNNKIRLAVEVLEGIAPRDALESMLSVQMIAVHNAIMGCLERAMHPRQTTRGHDHHLKQAVKLMAIYERQLAALDKHRGRGQQKITVEHVTVQAGGQAIVGSVETGNARVVPRRVAAPAPAPTTSDAFSGMKPVVDLATEEIVARNALPANNVAKKSSARKRDAG